MILRPSSVSIVSSPAAGATAAGAAGGGSTFVGSGGADGVRMREIGGRIIRLISSFAARFALGACGSINETLSTADFAGSGGGAGWLAERDSVAPSFGFAGAFFPVIGANADFVADGFDVSVRLGVSAGFVEGDGAASSIGAGVFAFAGATAAPSSVRAAEVSATLAGLDPAATFETEAARGRDEGLAVVLAAALRAGAFAAVDFVVVFVAIPFSKNYCAHGRERLIAGAMVREKRVRRDGPLRKSRALSLRPRRGSRQGRTIPRRVNLPNS